jgi:ABC-type multidrug transport system ATPase subunit
MTFPSRYISLSSAPLLVQTGRAKARLLKSYWASVSHRRGAWSSLEASRKELSLMRTRVGYVPDSCGAYQSLSAAENLRIRCAEWGLDEKREVPRVLGLVGLDVDEKKSVSSFSLGMKRRLDIATALLGDTDVLIFDEPANGLDPLGIESIWALIGRLNREQGKTMLISSHDLDELASVATSCLFLHDGELLKKESMDVIRDEAPSLKEYYRRLMKAVSL